MKESNLLNKIVVSILYLMLVWSVATAQEVFKNDELTISKLENRTWVVETNDMTTMYILEGDDQAMLIDTGTKCKELDKVVRKITQKPLIVVLTHNHRDHAGNIHYFDEVHMHPADTTVFPNSDYEGKFKWMKDGDVFDLGGRKIEVLLMAGHTPGSVIFTDHSIQAAFTGDAFGSGQVWLHLQPHVPMSKYYASCTRMEKVMNEQNITKLYIGHFPHVKRPLGIDYIVEMKELAKRLNEGDIAGAKDYPNMGIDIACEKPMIATNGKAMIVFDPENINGKKEVLILLAHPDISSSKANAAMIEAIKDFSFVRVINIYETPFKPETYREAFREAQHIVFQFPFYWASAPHMLKKWCDEIFMHIQSSPGVKGKTLTIATTTGSEYDAYRSGGRNMFTMDELLRPYQLLANHSGMVWRTPFVLYGASLPDAEKSIRTGADAYKGTISNLIHR